MMHPYSAQSTTEAASCPGADRKGACRLVSNPRVEPHAIQQPHFEPTCARCGEHPVVLCLNDTSELDFTHNRKVHTLGPIGDGAEEEARSSLSILPIFPMVKFVWKYAFSRVGLLRGGGLT